MDHLKNDASFLECSKCGRKTYSGVVNSICNMSQPGGEQQCDGTFKNQMEWIKIKKDSTNIPFSLVNVFSNGNIFPAWLIKIEISKHKTDVYFETYKTEMHPTGEIINPTHFMILKRPT